MTARAIAAFLVAASFLGACATSPKPEPPDQEIENLHAFAKLYGYVRWFHPSDEASEMDWDRFAVYGAEQVRHAADSADLKRTLESLFLPIAPTVAIHGVDDAAPAIPQCAEDATEWVAWQHAGVHLGSQSIYRSHRLNRRTELHGAGGGYAGWAIALDPAEVGGQQVRARARMRFEPSGRRSFAGLSVFAVHDGQAVVQEFETRSTSQDWALIETAAELPPDLDSVQVVGALVLGGQVWFDSVEIEVSADGQAWRPFALRNGGFESDEDWINYSQHGDFELDFVDDVAYEGRRSAHISGRSGIETITRPLFDKKPTDGEVVQCEIGSGLAITMPVSIPSVAGSTCPRPDEVSLAALRAAVDAVAPDDYSQVAPRVAAVMTVWNVFQHFYPYFDVVDVDWRAELDRALTSARQDEGAEDLSETLLRLVAATDDGHGWVYHPSMRESAVLPLALQEIEGQAIVVASKHPDIAVGERVLTVGGRDALLALEDAARRFSGSSHRKRDLASGFIGYGPRGSTVEIAIERAGTHVVLQVERSSEYVEVAPTYEPVTKVADRIWYVDLSRATDNLVAPHLDALASARGVIFDMRGYPKDYRGSLLGHLSDTALDLPQLNMPRIVYPDRERLTFRQSNPQIEPRSPRFEGQPVLLIGSGAISAAETVAGTFEHYAFGPIIGQPTAGTNGDTNRINLPGGFTVIFTGLKVLKQDGSQHHLIGIQPTVPLEPTIAGIREERDEYIEKAIEIINGEAP